MERKNIQKKKGKRKEERERNKTLFYLRIGSVLIIDLISVEITVFVYNNQTVVNINKS